MITIDQAWRAVGASVPCCGCGDPVQLVVVVEDVDERERRMVEAQATGSAERIAGALGDRRVRDLCLCRSCAHDLCVALVDVAREVEQERARAAIQVMAGAVAGKGRRGAAGAVSGKGRRGPARRQDRPRRAKT